MGLGLANIQYLDMTDAKFELLHLKNHTEISVPEGTNFKGLVHAKALLILHWQQGEEIERKLPHNLQLKLQVSWLNCSSWDPFLHHLPMPYYNVSTDDHSLDLHDFDCVPDTLRRWCNLDPGRELIFRYVLEAYLGHTIEMRFVCDAGIVEIQEDVGFYDGYGVMMAVAILLAMMGVSKVRKDREKSRHQKLQEALDSPRAQNSLPEQNPRFLTVPQRVRIRREDSGSKMMEGRMCGMDAVIPKFLKLDDDKKPRQRKDLRLPMIRVFEPDED